VPIDRVIRRVAIAAATVALILGGAQVSGLLPASWAVILANSVSLVPAVGAGLALSLAAFRLTGRERIAWALLASGVVAFATGDLAWVVVEAFGGTEGFMPADILYATAYPLWLAGVLLLPFARVGQLARMRVSLDGIAAAISIALLGWHLYLRQMIHAGADTAANTPGAAFGDVALLALVILLIARRSFQRFRLATLFFAAAIATTATADIIYANTPDYWRGVWYDGFWTLSYAGSGLAAWALVRKAPTRESNRRMSWLAMTIAGYGPVILLFALAAMDLFVGEVDAETRLMAVGAGCVIAVILCRQILALRSQRIVSERIQRELIASVAHELRTPLTVMMGFTDILAKDWRSFPDTERNELLRAVNDQTRHLNHIVGDLVTTAKGTIDRQELSLEKCDLSVVFADAVAMSGIGRSTDVKVAITPETTLVADRRRLVQALVNLLANAGHYGSGHVLLNGYPADGHVVVEVHDDGPGVPAQYRQVIWERFERGPYHLDPSKPGTGVGLAIVRSIVEAHGGEAGYEPSNALGGACFVISLPGHSSRRQRADSPITALLDDSGYGTPDNLTAWTDPCSSVSPTSPRVATHR
jgi:signal transduction histidine kinase